jgi:RNA recognition motif-containing protein
VNPFSPRLQILLSSLLTVLTLGNLSFSTNEDDLGNLFGDLKISSIRVIKAAGGDSKGFGYVDFADKESLQVTYLFIWDVGGCACLHVRANTNILITTCYHLQAALGRTGADLRGRNIRVDISNKREERPRGGAFGGDRRGGMQISDLSCLACRWHLLHCFRFRIE